MDKKLLLKKCVVILVGSVLSAYGITLAIHAGFGGATLAILWQGVSHVLPVSLGVASLIVAAVMIVFAFFYDRKQIHIGTVLYQLVYSSFLDIFSRCVFYTPYWYINVLIMVVGVVIFAAGAGLYSSANLGRGSYEAVTFALADKNHWQVRYVRIVLDISVVVLGILLGGQFGLCTIATVLLSGPVIQFSKQKADALLFRK